MSDDRQTILIVDDNKVNIDVLAQLLSSEYKIKVALNGKRALQIAKKAPSPDMILLDVMMPEMDGYEVCQYLKEDALTAKIPVIFVTAKDAEADERYGFSLGAVDYITKPISPSIVLSRVRTHLALHNQNRELAIKVKERTRELEDERIEVIQRLGRAAEYKDDETGRHITRVSHYARILAAGIGLDEECVEMLFYATPMHDIGKIGIPESILNKPGKLTPEEFEVIKTHPAIGSEILGDSKSELLTVARNVAFYHHEKWDGSGYPSGLKGEAIPLEARLMAVADVFDAVTSKRPYKEAWPIDKAVQMIKDNAGTHFDPQIVKAFIENFDDIARVQGAYSDN
jgi:putative two-component system response regulator